MARNEPAPLFEIARETPTQEDGPMVEAVRRTVDARIEAGLLDADLYAAEIAAALGQALRLDNADPRTKLYAYSQGYETISKLLAELPRPEVSAGASDLERALAVIQGGEDADVVAIAGAAS